MFYLECQCRFTGQWDEIPNAGPYSNAFDAARVAIFMAQSKRTTIRVVNDYGQVQWMQNP